MKIRNGFVSNSSSSSFVVDLDQISGATLRMIKRTAGQNDWQVDEQAAFLCMSTSMDNFDMGEFMEKLGVPRGAIQGPWEFLPSEYWGLEDSDDTN